MANLLYPLFKQRLLSPGIDLSSVTLRAVLVDTGTYTYSAAHDAYDDLAGVVGTESGTLGSKTFTNGVFDCADATFTAVTGATAEAVVIFVDSGTASTDYLVAYVDTGSNLPVTPNGGDITAQWNASGVFAL
ncbi:MAG: hypothetical protein IPJ48_15110 [Propionivibrio sp.]|jgi:hypothetical protein|uniref:Bacteriophage protein n=1 Tax=Candidatus Propionivibrio dominans TaxID=2954373 RepID=A0A9D7I9L8_9RHOO|nr:hypothetical protein [Candidatus Propionivibrio dominans]